MWPKFPDNCFTVDEKSLENFNHEIDPTGDQTRVRCVRSNYVTPNGVTWWRKWVFCTCMHATRIERKSRSCIDTDNSWTWVRFLFLHPGAHNHLRHHAALPLGHSGVQYAHWCTNCVEQDAIEHGLLARWIKWKTCDVGEAKEGLENELWRRRRNERVGEWAVT